MTFLPFFSFWCWTCLTSHQCLPCLLHYYQYYPVSLLQVDEEAPSLTASRVVELSYRTSSINTHVFYTNIHLQSATWIKIDKSGTHVFVRQEQKTYKLKQDFNTLSKHVVPEFEFSLQEAWTANSVRTRCAGSLHPRRCGHASFKQIIMDSWRIKICGCRFGNIKNKK